MGFKKYAEALQVRRLGMVMVASRDSEQVSARATVIGMHDPDLEEYRLADAKSGRYADFGLKTRNIGWLWSDLPFEQGAVPANVTRKLRDVLNMGSFRKEGCQVRYSRTAVLCMRATRGNRL
ncbi:hypothetical protein LAJ19_20745 (plasmid) [Deinococcus taeanensis]|uniref:hypothetical protein n=1 Tax=Deinococcus taeanensis TaxID=2737050 RepID=UPI001CDC6B75|nr:hypothetical protein [Deinococcus taeanensis]UBV45231.1 hypothetical protein LAJ19_20745 [Deinococcus taeanensis]